jgi:mannitol operon transcriptional antiterminator
LLTADDPLILNWLQHIAAVSRPTVLSDLDLIEEWVRGHKLTLIRRQHYGLAIEGSELARRQALTALLWGDSSFEEPLTEMTYHEGLRFIFADDASGLPLVEHTKELLSNLDIKTMIEQVGSAETQLGGRFTDNTVLHLALALSIQRYRIQTGRYVEVEAETIHWLEIKNVWPVAMVISQNLQADLQWDVLLAEVSHIAMQLLAGTRHHVWPGDLYVDPALTDLIGTLMKEVAQAFNVIDLIHDPSLRDGLFAHIIPAILRQRFGLWTPPVWSDGRLSRKYGREYNIARELSTVITEQTGVILPDGEIDTLTLLLRAAFIRERPYRAKRVFIVCPSGMATAQLLLARLKPQFPSLNIVGVLSVRELSPERVAGAHFLITTVPLEESSLDLPVIQVHPLLYPDDVDAITSYLLG